ncbi:hypothetical protein NQZ68_007633 [Dissostichus eleginoides]|nr:hypothetical protein NQZ68_007633 [Dissostichus eleginoides]
MHAIIHPERGCRPIRAEFGAEVWIPGCLVVPHHPGRAIRASALSFGGTFSRGKSPFLHLGLCT